MGSKAAVWGPMLPVLGSKLAGSGSLFQIWGPRLDSLKITVRGHPFLTSNWALGHKRQEMLQERQIGGVFNEVLDDRQD